MSTYNKDLQTNNTSLQNILNTVNTLPDSSSVDKTIQKWTFTLEDNSTVDKYVEVPKEEYTITIAASGLDECYYNILHGNPFSCNLLEYLPDGYHIRLAWVKMGGIDITNAVYDNVNFNIYIPCVTDNVDIIIWR